MTLDGARIAFGDGRPLSDRPDLAVLLDSPRDTAAWPVWVATATTPTVEYALAGLAGAVDRAALFVPDRPGQLVLRTLAQLANAAADAVEDQIADAHAIDEAMVSGANHPQGPLAWAEAFGRQRVWRALDHMAEATGDAIYRPSAWFFRQPANAAEIAA